MAKLSPFDFIDAITTQAKPDLMADDPTNEKAYLPFIINRHFSYFPDTVLLANEMNKASTLPNRLQFDFYRAVMRPKKRFAKWIKPERVDSVEIVAEYYKMNKTHARQAVLFLSAEAIKEMKAKLSHGGLVKDK